MISRMFFHTLAATVIVAGLAGAWQTFATPDAGWSVAGEYRQQAGGGHDD